MLISAGSLVCSARVAVVIAACVAPAFAQSLSGLRIEGPADVPEETTARYIVIAEFDNGWEFEVTLSAQLSAVPGLHAQIGEFGNFTAFEIEDDSSEEIRARFEFSGQIADATLAVMIKNTPPAGYALEFDGVDDVVRIPRSPALEPTEALTIEVWARADSTGSRHSRLVRNAGDDATGYILAWKQDYNAHVQLRLHNQSGNGYGTVECADDSPSSTYVGQWHHFAGTYSASDNEARLYVDGLLKAQSPGFGPMSYSDEDVFIGDFTAAPSEEAFEGAIDEVRIWNTARTQCEIQGHMHRRLAGDEPGLVGYWRFDQGIGQVVMDSSAGKSHGLLGWEAAPESDSGDPLWEVSTSGVTREVGGQPGVSDIDCDGDADLHDASEIISCLLGPRLGILIGCQETDVDDSGHIDLVDFAQLQASFTGER